MIVNSRIELFYIADFAICYQNFESSIIEYFLHRQKKFMPPESQHNLTVKDLLWSML